MTAQVYEFGDTLAAGFEGMFDEGRGYQLAVVKLTDILVEKQIREEMEDQDSTLDDMQGSVKKHGILQTLLLRPIAGPIPYKLVAGERRYRGAERAGETEVPALIKEMTDSEAEDIQLAENIHRKNLTQVEEAKKIQRDLDELGSVEAVLEKHNKGRAWLSKMLGLLTLPEQAKRLLTEKVSADLEVIGMVKAVEKVDPAAAAQLVDQLKDTRGKVDARATAKAVKEQVKPRKAKPDQAPVNAGPTVFPDAKNTPTSKWPFPTTSAGVRPSVAGIANAANVAPVAAVASAANARNTLERAYGLIVESGASAQLFVDTLSVTDRDAIEAWLDKHYHDGRKSDDAPRAIMLGLRKGTFATDGAPALAMMAFLQGSMSSVRPLDVVRILSLVKP